MTQNLFLHNNYGDSDERAKESKATMDLIYNKDTFQMWEIVASIWFAALSLLKSKALNGSRS